MEATFGSHVDLMRLLLERGAELDVITETYGEPALLVACACGHVDAARLLLERGADVTRAATSGPGHGMDALCGKAHKRRVPSSRLLEEHMDLKFPLHAATRTGDIDAMTQLLDGGAEVDTTKDGATPLFVACEHGHVDAVRLLLERGAGVDGAAKDTASGAGVGAARLLQAQGAPIDRNEGCRTPLLAASANGHSDVVRLLLEQRRWS